MKKIKFYLLISIFWIGQNLFAQTTSDAGISELIAPNGTITSGTTMPVVALKNFGSNTLNSVVIFYKIDNNAESRMVWTGFLEINEVMFLALPIITGYSAGTHTFSARTASPNGGTDSNTSNDAQFANFTYVGTAPTTDAGIYEIIAPVGNIATATSVTPSVILKNYGTNTLISATIIYNVDNGPDVNQTWVGNLERNASIAVSLPAITNYRNGGHTFTVRTSAPNGTIDDNTANDAKTSNFTNATAQIDAGISAIITPNGTINTESMTPSVSLRNYGTNTLTSATIFYKIDDNIELYYIWTGNLPTNATVLVSLPDLTGYASGTHRFTARTSAPNRSTDDNTTNDTWTANFTYTAITSTTDAGILAIAVPNGTITTVSMIPTVTLKNFGSTTLVSVPLFYKIDNGVELSQTWTGTLAPNAITTFNLGSLTGYAIGTHTFTIRTGSPNGTSDANTANDAATSNFVYTTVAPIADAGISAIITPNGSITNLSMPPSVTLKNFGLTPLTSVTVFYKIDNETEIRYFWTGNLVANGSVTLIFPTLTGYTSGAHTFTARTDAPNGGTDANTSNDVLTSNFVYSFVTPTTDAGIFAIGAPNGQIITSSINPSVVLKNFGTNTLTSATIFYKVDNGTESSFLWTGYLLGNNSLSVTIPPITAYSAGNHTFAARTSAPNGITDNNTANDLAQSNFNYTVVDPKTDAGITAIIAPDSFYVTKSSALIPVVVLKNFGPNPLTSVRIHSKVDYGAESTMIWLGILNANETTTLSLSPITGYSPDEHIFTARTDLPNDLTDSNITNDTAITKFTYMRPNPITDASIFTIITPTGLIATSSVTPYVVLKNYGVSTLTSVNIYYKVDYGIERLYTWTGSLGQNASTTVILPDINNYTQAGHTFWARTDMPNGVIDDNPSNDANYSNFTYSTAFSTTDASIVGIIAPNGTINTKPTTPSVILKNFGSATLTSVTIFYKIDNGAEMSQVWMGSLATNVSTTITLASITDYGHGAHTFSVRTSAPNGTTDNNTANDIATANFFYSGFSVWANDGVPSNSNISINRGILIENEGRINRLDVFPNPAKNHIQLIVNVFSSSSYDLSIFNVSGNCILKEQRTLVKGMNNIEVALGNIAKGLYLVKMQKGNELMTQKIIIE